MLRKVSILILLVALGLSAEFWVNAIRDPGAELGAGDWDTDILARPEGSGAGDSARVDAHDSTRAYEGKFSFLTDTDKNPMVGGGICNVWCYQCLSVPKAVCDLDTCYWHIYCDEYSTASLLSYHIRFRSQGGKNILWFSGNGSRPTNDTIYSIEFQRPGSGKWIAWRGNIYKLWTNNAGWSEFDTIVEVQLLSRGGGSSLWWGQEVSWDNVGLRSVAYYDYAAKSIDSDELAEYRYTPVATFANEGIKDDIPGTVYAEILEGTSVVYRDSQEISIPHESSEQVEFREWKVPHDGSYTLRVYPILELDEYSADDTLEQTLTGVGVGERLVDVELVTTRYTPSGILFSFSSGSSGEFSIYDASGREIYNQSVQPGTRELLWSTRDVPSGLYFYKIETPTSRLTDKLLILH